DRGGAELAEGLLRAVHRREAGRHAGLAALARHEDEERGAFGAGLAHEGLGADEGVRAARDREVHAALGHGVYGVRQRDGAAEPAVTPVAVVALEVELRRRVAEDVVREALD